MSEPQPKAPSTLAWVWRLYLSRHWLRITVVVLLSIVLGLVSQQFLIRTESGLRVIFDHGAASDLLWICVIVAVLFVIRAVVGYVIPVLMARVSNDVIYHLRRDLLRHILGLDLAWFDRTHVGDILQRLIPQTQALGQYIGSGLANALRDLATVLIVATYLLWKSPVLFLAALLLLPFIVRMMNRVAHRSRQVQTETDAAMTSYLSGVEESISGIRTIKIAGQEASELRRLTGLSRQIRDLSRHSQRVQARILPSIDLASAFVYLLVIGGGGMLALRSESGIDGATIITFLLGMVMLIEPARLVAQFFGNLPPHLVRLEQVRAVFDEHPRVINAPDAVCDFDASGDVRLSNVHFAYSPAEPVFQGLSLTLPGGKVSAIVGETGSGKTTVLALLARLYDVQSGTVSIGGRPVTEIDISALRSAFAVVSQDVVIFDASIWENIRYMDPDARDDQIRAAAEVAGLTDLIRKRGDAPVGPRGAQLSGGQRQRIAIARAFLRNAPILLLDEATSALDLHSEARIQAAMSRLMRGRTTVIVAHRLSAVTEAERIFVLSHGQLIEEGSHANLLQAQGSYARLYRLQERQREEGVGDA